MTLMGVSLGALAAPPAQRVAAEAGAAPGWTILAYGGAPIGDLVDANPFVRPPWVRPLLRAATDLLLRPLEPGAHLPHLEGRFLVIEGSADQFVPPAAAALMRELTPAPKTVVRLPGGHIGVGPDRQRILDEVLRQGRAWLVAEGAVHPPP
jgi:pimeloyl-ACP methyl ester carboxylesterase